jgi:hypothetical protein
MKNTFYNEKNEKYIKESWGLKLKTFLYMAMDKCFYAYLGL